MKKHVFLLGSFMASSLVAANTLLVIACQKKANVSGDKETEKPTEQVELEIANKLKAEIKNIIDDVMTNISDKENDWLINLNDKSLNNHKEIVKFLNDKVNEIKKRKWRSWRNFVWQDGFIRFKFSK